MGNKTILVVGGGGYIGSHCCLDLAAHGYAPVIVDNFSTGNPDLAERTGVPIERVDIADRVRIDGVMAHHAPVAVMHFAAHCYVGESVTDPEKYYANNVSAALTLLSSMRAHGVKHFIFSSTCATYGVPEIVPIAESCPQSPINPYGRTKLMVEWALKDLDHAYGLRHVNLRYFNAAGADPEGRIGERHDPETHLIPLAIVSALTGKEIKVFGNDYPTPDGTCIRDYIHILDLAQAHRLALEYLLKNGASDSFNLGTGDGYSVLEIFEAVKRASGKEVRYTMAGRREGDPPKLVAESTKARSVLGWKPTLSGIDTIVGTAHRWHAQELGF